MSVLMQIAPEFRDEAVMSEKERIAGIHKLFDISFIK